MDFATLFGAISAVPTLGSRCSSVLTDGVPGSGLKTMRLVSKQIRAAMLDAVTGYTLRLNGSAQSLMNEMGMLQGTKLSCLRVVVMDDADGVFPGGLNGWSAHTQHLRCFLHGMASALSSVTRLELTSECKESTHVGAVTALLSLLAPACPALLQLQLTGNIGREFLAACGAFCHSLSILEVMSGVESDTLQQLHLILPSITHCTVAAPLAEQTNVPEAGPCCLALTSCKSLTYLDTGGSTLSLSMWLALPQGLRELRCALPTSRDDGLEPLRNLERLTCQFRPYMEGVPLSSLVAVLQAAPALKSVSLRATALGVVECLRIPLERLFVSCAPDDVADLCYLHERVTAGVSLNTVFAGGEVSNAITLRMWDTNGVFDMHDDAEMTQRCNMASCLARLPPFPAFTHLMIWASYKHNSISSFSAGMAVAFPNLTHLALSLSTPICSSDLIHLGGHSNLQQLALVDCQVDPISLAMLCNRLPYLKVLHVEPDKGFPVAEKSLQSLLQLWGFNVKVMVV